MNTSDNNTAKDGTLHKIRKYSRPLTLPKAAITRMHYDLRRNGNKDIVYTFSQNSMNFIEYKGPLLVGEDINTLADTLQVNKAFTIVQLGLYNYRVVGEPPEGITEDHLKRLSIAIYETKLQQPRRPKSPKTTKHHKDTKCGDAGAWGIRGLKSTRNIFKKEHE